VISKNTERSDKKLWTDQGDGRAVHVIQVANERAEGEAIVRAIQNATDLRGQGTIEIMPYFTVPTHRVGALKSNLCVWVYRTKFTVV
jgi:superfamily I DNA/RNA helicase